MRAYLGLTLHIFAEHTFSRRKGLDYLLASPSFTYLLLRALYMLPRFLPLTGGSVVVSRTLYTVPYPRGDALQAVVTTQLDRKGLEGERDRGQAEVPSYMRIYPDDTVQKGA